MGVGAGLYMHVVVVQKFTFAISSPDEFLFYKGARKRDWKIFLAIFYNIYIGSSEKLYLKIYY